MSCTCELHEGFCWVQLMNDFFIDDAEKVESASVRQLLELIEPKDEISRDGSNVKSAYREWSDAWLTVSDGFIIAAFLKFIGLETPGSSPKRFRAELTNPTWSSLRQIAKDFLKEYAVRTDRA